MNHTEFWLRWRRDIFRGLMIFGVVVGAGLTIQSMVGRGRQQLLGFREAFDPHFQSADRQHDAPWTYATPLAAQRTLWLRNISGSISVEASDGHSVEIQADRSFKHSPGDSVRILVTETKHGLTVCAVWPGKPAQCGPDGRYNTEGSMEGNDVAVMFVVRLPRGVKLDASTINGDIDVTGASAPVGAGTVNGSVTVEALLGPVRATTVNGDVRAMIRGFAGPGDVNLTTVNGDAFVELPATLDAVLDGHTVAGDIATDFPLTVTGKFASHALTGTLGKGGRKIRLQTVTGDVEVRKTERVVDVTTSVTPAPPAAPTRATQPRGTRRPRPGTP
ncbi:MAG: DUF4097 family beta strand repeat-containing protein [Gemmatimonadales bacterium]